MNYETRRLRGLVEINPSVPDAIRKDASRLLSFVPMEAIGEDWSLDLSRERPVSDVLTGYSYFENDDILLAKVTPCFENGKSTVANGLKNGAGFGTTEVTVIRPSRSLNTRFVFYVLNEKRFKQMGESQMTGAGGLKRVPDRAILDYRVELPNRHDQDAIASFLDRETADIDAFIADQEELIALLAERRAATINLAVTAGLDPSAPVRESETDWIKRIPRHWTVNRFSRCVRINEGLVDPERPPFAEMILIAPNHVESHTGRIRSLESAASQGAESGKYLVRRGQVIFSKIRPNLAKIVVAPLDCMCSADMYALDARSSEELNHRFLRWMMLSRVFTDYAVEQSARVAMPKLNRETIGAAPVWYPGIQEQAEIADHLDRETAELDAAIADAREAIALSKERRAALISAAVTGKIDVRGVA